MQEVFVCDALRTPIGRYGGGLSAVRTDDLAAIPIRAIMARHPEMDWSKLDDVILGCANQSGEDNRNVARMAVLLAGLPQEVPGMTINRLCASGLDAIANAARAIGGGEAELIIAGGVESMSRAPYVMGKASAAFERGTELYDTTLGWRFVNPKLESEFGVDTMPETAENLAEQFQVSREDQDRFAFWSQTKAAAAQTSGELAKEIIPVSIPQRKAEPLVCERDEHLRLTPLEKLSHLRTPFREGGTITAGNASGINDGAAAVLLASEAAVKQYDLQPLARYVASAVAGVPPRIMGIGPVPATRKLLDRLGMSLNDLDLIEINAAFAVQVLTCTRELGLADDDPRINQLGGAIALGHPLGMSGTRLAVTAVHQLQAMEGKRALCTMCVGVGQGMATILERC